MNFLGWPKILYTNESIVDGKVCEVQNKSTLKTKFFYE